MRPAVCGPASTTVTSRPNFVAVEATSAPMKPAPITTSLEPGRRSSRRASASSMVRSTWTPASRSGPCHARARAPVATTTPSARTSLPSSNAMAPPPASSRIAWTPNTHRASMLSSSPSRARSLSQISPTRNSLDSGGRSYGRRTSAPTIVSSPSNPWRRSARAADSPASDAPTTATLLTDPPLR